MELIIGAVFALPLYLAAGITVARSQYAAAINAPVPEDKQDEHDRLTAEKEKVSHGRYCDSRYGLRCDCGRADIQADIQEKINALRADGDPQMSTIVTWPAYLLKRAALKVYTPRPKPLPVYDNYDEGGGAATESPYLAKIRDMEERHEKRMRIESDPLYKQLASEWDKVEKAYAEDFQEPAEVKAAPSAGVPKGHNYRTCNCHHCWVEFSRRAAPKIGTKKAPK